MDDRETIQLLALGRAVLGAALFFAPAASMRSWMGVSDGSTIAVWSTRGLGARDVAIGIGTLVSLDKGTSVKGWLEAGVVADAADTISTLGAFGEMPRWRRWGWLAISGGAAVLGLKLAAEVD